MDLGAHVLELAHSVSVAELKIFTLGPNVIRKLAGSDSQCSCYLTHTYIVA